MAMVKGWMLIGGRFIYHSKNPTTRVVPSHQQMLMVNA
jgi:hypothetical protein